MNDAPALASVRQVPVQYLYRVFNQGWPRGHHSGSNEWGSWALCSEEDAIRLERSDREGVYEFVPYVPRSPLVKAFPAACPPGFVLVPDAANMTDEQAEAIAKVANVCGGIAYDIYRAALETAPSPEPKPSEAVK